MTTRTWPWHLWPGRHWPASATEERRFVTDLEQLTSSPARRYERGDLTTVLNALRCGLSVDDVQRVAPGVDPAKLLAAHRDIDARRADAVAAWAAIEADPVPELFDAQTGDRAARIAPIAVARVRAAQRIAGPGAAVRMVRSVTRRMHELADEVASTEADLARVPAGDVAGVELGRTLYDPYRSSLWGHPLYLATRPGALVPVRVRMLLDEVSS